VPESVHTNTMSLVAEKATLEKNMEVRIKAFLIDMNTLMCNLLLMLILLQGYINVKPFLNSLCLLLGYPWMIEPFFSSYFIQDHISKIFFSSATTIK
jgi:hypothetical protein